MEICTIEINFVAFRIRVIDLELLSVPTSAEAC